MMQHVRRGCRDASSCAWTARKAISVISRANCEGQAALLCCTLHTVLEFWCVMTNHKQKNWLSMSICAYVHIMNDQNVDHLTALENNGKHVDTFTADVVRIHFRCSKAEEVLIDACRCMLVKGPRSFCVQVCHATIKRPRTVLPSELQFRTSPDQLKALP